VPVLAKAGTAWFGECCPQSASELSSPIFVPPFGNPLYGAWRGGSPPRGWQARTSTRSSSQGAESTFEPADEGRPPRRTGAKVNKFVTLALPQGPRTYSPQVAEATGGRCRVRDRDLRHRRVAAQSMDAAMAASRGLDAKMYGPPGQPQPRVANHGLSRTAQRRQRSQLPPASTRTSRRRGGRTSGRQSTSTARTGGQQQPQRPGHVGGGVQTASTKDPQRANEGDDRTRRPSWPPREQDHEPRHGGPGPPTARSDQAVGHRRGNKGFGPACMPVASVSSKIEGGKVKPATTQFQNAISLRSARARLSGPRRSDRLQRFRFVVL
jgi:hypothetical protein